MGAVDFDCSSDCRFAISHREVQGLNLAPHSFPWRGEVQGMKPGYPRVRRPHYEAAESNVERGAR